MVFISMCGKECNKNRDVRIHYLGWDKTKSSTSKDCLSSLKSSFHRINLLVLNRGTPAMVGSIVCGNKCEIIGLQREINERALNIYSMSRFKRQWPATEYCLHYYSDPSIHVFHYSNNILPPFKDTIIFSILFLFFPSLFEFYGVLWSHECPNSVFLITVYQSLEDLQCQAC